MLYAVFTFGFLCFFYKYLPETKNLPLEDITDAFHNDNWGKNPYISRNDGPQQYERLHHSDSDKGTNDDDDEFHSDLERDTVREALLKSKYFEDSNSESSRRHSGQSRNPSDLSFNSALSGQIAAEVSYSTQNDESGLDRPSIVDI